jgi:hypothetical protein
MIKKPLHRKKSAFQPVFLLAALTLFGCVTLFGSKTPPSNPSTSSGTPASKKTQTSGGTIKGGIYLDSPDRKPFVTDVDLRRVSDSQYLFSQKSDSQGQFAFLSVPPGRYDLWVFITADTPEALGCNNIVLQDGNNSFGVRYNEDDLPLTVPQESLKQVIELDRVQRGSSTNPKTLKGYYAASGPIVVTTGQTEEIVIEMLCQQ